MLRFFHRTFSMVALRYSHTRSRYGLHTTSFFSHVTSPWPKRAQGSDDHLDGPVEDEIMTPTIMTQTMTTATFFQGVLAGGPGDLLQFTLQVRTSGQRRLGFCPFFLSGLLAFFSALA